MQYGINPIFLSLMATIQYVPRYLLPLEHALVEEERVMQQSSVSISLGF